MVLNLYIIECNAYKQPLVIYNIFAVLRSSQPRELMTSSCKSSDTPYFYINNYTLSSLLSVVYFFTRCFAISAANLPGRFS